MRKGINHDRPPDRHRRHRLHPRQFNCTSFGSLNMDREEMIAELHRRLKDRNIPGYWGCNARAWAHKIIRELRQL